MRVSIIPRPTLSRPAGFALGIFMSEAEAAAFGGQRAVVVTSNLAAGLVFTKAKPGEEAFSRVFGLGRPRQMTLPGRFLGLPYTGPTLRPFEVQVVKLPGCPDGDALVTAPVLPGSFELLPVHRQLPGGFRKTHHSPSPQRRFVEAAHAPQTAVTDVQVGANGHQSLVPVSTVEPTGLADDQAAWISEMRTEINSFVTRGLIDLSIEGGHLRVCRVERQVILKVGEPL